jgi:hypothetical protein
MPNDTPRDITITISLQKDNSGNWKVIADAGTADSVTEDNNTKALGWRRQKVHWKADQSVSGIWVVGMKDRNDTPFKKGRWLFSGSTHAADTGTVGPDEDDYPGAQHEFTYWVMVATSLKEGANQMVYADPILVIRNPSGGGPVIALADLAEEAALLKERAAEVAEHAADLSKDAKSLARHARELATHKREGEEGKEARAGNGRGDSAEVPES